MSRLVAPQAFELNYLRQERKVNQWMLARFSSMAPVLAILFAVVSVLSYLKLSDGNSYAVLNGFKNYYYFSYAMPLLIVFSLAGIYVPPRWLMTYRIVTSLACWFILIQMLESFSDGITKSLAVVFFLPILYLISVGTIMLRRHQQLTAITAIVLFSIIFWAGYSAVYFFRDGFDPNLLTFFWEFKIPFFWLFVCYFYLAGEAKAKLDFLFNPAHVTRGVLWPGHGSLGETQTDRKSLWMLGIQNLFVAFLVMNLRLALETLLTRSQLEPFPRVSFVMILRLLTDIGICNLITAVARMYGFRVPDATHFVLLAKTPAEYWRRGSVYTFQFVFRFIYLPVARSFKNRFLAVFLGFLFFYANRTGFTEFVRTGTSLTFSNEARVNAYVFVLYFLSIVISQKYWFFSKTHLEKASFAWISILLTHLTNISLVFFARYLGGL